MTELQIYSTDIVFQPSKITFNAYNKILADAKQVAEYLAHIDVTEENIKEAKKIRANANKALNNLQDERKRIKKELLEPYENFNKQVQEIAQIVDEANSLVDEQIRELEEKERDQKVIQISEIWEKQIITFPYSNLVHFDDFFESKYANKTYSLNKIESEMAAFLEKVGNDITFLKTNHNEEYVIEYLKTFDVVHAMSTVKERHRAIELLQDTSEDDDIIEVEETPVAIFEIKGNAEIKLVEKLLQENEINYRKL